MVAEASALRGQRWRAWNALRPGSIELRVPCPDSLNDIDRVYLSFLARVQGRQYFPELKLTRFNKVNYMNADSLPQRSCARFELPDGVAFRHEDTVKAHRCFDHGHARKPELMTTYFPAERKFTSPVTLVNRETTCHASPICPCRQSIRSTPTE